MSDTCVICDQETTKRCYNEYYEKWESVCHDCAPEFWTSSCVAIPSEVSHE